METGDKIILKKIEELKNTTFCENIMYKDILGQEVKVIDIYYSKKYEFYGVKLGGNKMIYIETNAGNRFLIEPCHIVI